MDELGVEGLVNRVFPGPPAGHVTTWLSWDLAIFEGSVQESNPGPLALVKLTWVQHSNHSATELHSEACNLNISSHYNDKMREPN